ncbi:MFS transporter [Candidatus Dojkabacteria bacterium]|nr:MFS transporter [Candidatus Dojkabacteria bacterium]
MKLKRFFKFCSINKIIRLLTYSDILIITGWGLINPVISVFFTEQIKGADIRTVGVASTIYFVTKSFVQIPLARIIDIYKGDRDDYRVMVVGSILVSMVPFLYTLIDHPTQLFLIQFVYGVGCAMAYPSWLAIFTRNIDKDQEGLEWSVHQTTTDIGSALAASLGSLLIFQFGYETVFILVGILNLLGTSLLLLLSRKFPTKNKKPL